jgi:hypothetical protein
MSALPWDRFQPDDETAAASEPLPKLEPRPATEIPPEPNKPTEDLIERVEPVPEELPPPNPEERVNLPAPQSNWNFKDILVEAFQSALDEAKPRLQEQASTYAKETIGAAIRGDDVDYSHPSVVATTSRGKELVVADARNRSWRTLLQGLSIDLLFAILAVVASASGNNPFAKATWIAVGILLCKTILQTIFAYFMRLRVTPTIREKGEKVALVPVPEPVIEKVSRHYQ